MMKKKLCGLLTLIAGFLVIQSCEKIEDTRSYAPVLFFEKSTETVKTDVGSYDVKLVLSKPAEKEIKADPHERHCNRRSAMAVVSIHPLRKGHHHSGRSRRRKNLFCSGDDRTADQRRTAAGGRSG